MIALVSYIYPNAAKYIDAFIEDLKFQTYCDFDLILFNDGLKEFNSNLYYKKINIVDIEGSPLEIRIKSFKLLGQMNYTKYIFLDIDDLMSKNRVECLSEKLVRYPIVCNDLNLMSESGAILNFSIWKSRLKNNFSFDYNFLKDKNIVGFGNVGIRKEVLQMLLQWSKYPKVADWFVFYQLLKLTKKKCIFTTECQTNYRQHADNQVGMKEVSKEKLIFALDVAEMQFKGLREIGCEDIKLDKNQLGISNTVKNNYPFWWEEIKIINEKNNNQ